MSVVSGTPCGNGERAYFDVRTCGGRGGAEGEKTRINERKVDTLVMGFMKERESKNAIENKGRVRE
jgi:hypothetical protein